MSPESSWTTSSWIIFFTVFSTLRFFVLMMDVIDDRPSSLYISFCSIEFMFIIILLWSSNLPGDKISEMSIKIFRNFILTVWCKIMLSFFNVWYYFTGNTWLFKSLFDNVLDLKAQHSLYVLSTAWARDSIAAVQLSDPVIWLRSRQSKDCRRLVMVESLIRRYFTFVFCWEDFF